MRTLMPLAVGVSAALCNAQPPAQPADPPLDWARLEAPFLSGHLQLTHRTDFVKAGEAYFNADGGWIIFQAVPVPPAGRAPDAFYSMYAARLQRDADGDVIGLDPPILLSPPGSANTCGWFHPTEPGLVLFGSTLVPPATDQRSGFQVRDRRYVWLFPQETEIVQRFIPQLYADLVQSPPPEGRSADCVTVFSAPDYQAECSWSADGRLLLYATVRPERTDGRPDADIWIHDTRTGRHEPIITADGYDGGPFFSPDGRWICYRSDRALDDHLQLFIAELKFDAEGVPVGIQREIRLTGREYVSWAPYWHPSGRYLVYGTSEVSHGNYEVFAVETDPSLPIEVRRRIRLTHADGADVLPVFSDDGRLMMWTGQRGPMLADEQRPSSQLWLARVGRALDPDVLFPARADPSPP